LFSCDEHLAKTGHAGETVPLHCGDFSSSSQQVYWTFRLSLHPNDNKTVLAYEGSTPVLPPTFEGRLSLDGSTLYITNVSTSDDGIYTCKTCTGQQDNIDICSEKRYIHLTVHGKSVVVI